MSEYRLAHDVGYSSLCWLVYRDSRYLCSYYSKREALDAIARYRRNAVREIVYDPDSGIPLTDLRRLWDLPV